MRPPLSSTISRLSTVPSRSVSVSDDIVADELVALRVHHDDIALGADLAGLAVPDDLVGGDVIAVARPSGPAPIAVTMSASLS